MIRGSVRKVSDKSFNVSTTIHNRFDIEVLDASTGEIKQRAFAENVICDQLWAKLCSSGTYNYAIQYGDGQGTPSPSDTSLFSFLGYIASSVHRLHYDYDNDVFICTTKAVLNESTAVGKTLTEVGISHSSTATSLVTHAMLKDMNGNPVSLEKSDTDIFNIYATIYVHFRFPSEQVRVVGAYRYNGAVYTATLLGHLCGLSSMPTLYLQRTIGMAVTNSSKEITPRYDAVNKTITLSATRLAVTDWNQGGLASFCISGGTTGQGGFPQVVADVGPQDGWYEQTRVLGESLGTGDGETVDFATGFGRVANATVYVDGVPVECEVSGLDHTLTEKTESFKPLAYPLLSYFRVLRHPCVAYGYYNSNYYQSSLLCRPDSNAYVTLSVTGYPSVYENPLWEKIGVYSVYHYLTAVRASNNLRDWVTITAANSSATTTVVPEEYRHYRYWSIEGTSTQTGSSSNLSRSYLRFTSTDEEALKAPKNIHLVEPPPAGSVITADYDALCVGKDSNHVFDFSITLKFGEYTEAQ